MSNMKLRLCKYCKKSFIQKPSTKGFYCSIFCYHSDYKGKRVASQTEFKPGMSPWNKGLGKKFYCKNCHKEFTKSNGSRRIFCKSYCRKYFYFSDEKKEMIQKRKASLPKKIGWNRGGKALWATGEKNVNWKGGVTTESRLQRVYFRKTIQKTIFERDDFTCQICGERGVELQVDHIKKWSQYPELRFDSGNCRTLCKACHYQITFGRTLLSKDVPWGKNLKSLNGGY